MKKLSLLLFVLLSSLFVKAKIITVNNNTNALGQYSSVQDAIDAAFINDTLLINSSPTSYGNITIRKKLTLIGEGYLTSSDEKAKITTLGNVFVDTIAGGDVVSGTIFNGLKMSFLSTNSNANFPINRVIVANCQVNNSIAINHGLDWEIYNSRMSSVSGLSNNVTIQNSIFVSTSVDINNFKGGLISNCVFRGDIANASFLQIQNCIFTATDRVILNSTNVAIINTSFTIDSVDANILSTDGNTATNCFFGNDPRFIDEVDYQLDPDGPTGGIPNILLNAGIDGKDIGITGGNYPIAVLDGRVNLPQVQEVVVKTGVIAPGENLIIDVTGRSRR